MKYEEFKEFINNSHAIVLFMASNCEPCIKIKRLIEDYGPFKGYNFKIINIDDNKKFAVKEQIFKVPTLKMYEDGELDYTLTGVHDIENYIKSRGGDIMNNVSLIGRLVRDVDTKYTQSGKACANFTIAVDRGLSKDKKAEAEAKGYPTADFIPIVVWGKQAEHCQTYLAKGRLVAILGSIQTRLYQVQDGSARYVTEVLAANVEFIDWGEKKNNTQTQTQTQTHTQNSKSFNDCESEFVAVSDDDVPF